MLKVIAGLAGVKALGQGLSIVKNILAAHLLSPDDYGLASIYLILFVLVDSFSNLSLDKYLISTTTENLKKKLGVAHSVSLARSVLVSIALYLSSDMLGVFFVGRDLSDGILVISVILLLRGFENLKYKQDQRDLKLLPVAYVECCSQAVGVMAMCVLFYVGEKSGSVLYALFFQQASCVALSHYFSSIRLRFSVDSDVFKEVLLYGLPLLLNGMVVYMAMHGDKLLVARFFEVSVLGAYHAALVLLVAPVLLYGNFGISLFLPVFSKEKALAKGSSFQMILKVSIALALVYVCVGGMVFNHVVEYIFGEEYRLDPLLVFSLLVLCGLRIVKVPLSALCLSLRCNSLILKAGIIRASAVVPIFYLLGRGAEINVLPLLGVVFEVVSIAYMIVQLVRKGVDVQAVLMLFSGGLLAVAFPWIGYFSGDVKVLVLFVLMAAVIVGVNTYGEVKKTNAIL